MVWVVMCRGVQKKIPAQIPRPLKATAEWQEVPHNAICPATFSAFFFRMSGSTIRTLLHGKINPKDWQVSSLGDVGVSPIF